MNQNPVIPSIIRLVHKPSEKGNITFFENDELSTFFTKRVFWISNVPSEDIRGVHAHRLENQVLVCLKGKVKVSLENVEGQQFEFFLENENEGLIVPKMHWQSIKFSENSILLVFADKEYSEEDYIRDKIIFDEFRSQN